VKKSESFESAVARELEEEIGVAPIYWFDKNSKNWSSLPILFGERLEKILAPKEKDIHFHRDFIFVVIIDYRLLEESFAGECKGRLKWFTLEDISKLNPVETTPETLELIKELEKFQKELLG
jgi:8-oxo-dGTP pyrophosphatase MutT (NUDIX family)